MGDAYRMPVPCRKATSINHHRRHRRHRHHRNNVYAACYAYDISDACAYDVYAHADDACRDGRNRNGNNRPNTHHDCGCGHRKNGNDGNPDGYPPLSEYVPIHAGDTGCNNRTHHPFCGRRYVLSPTQCPHYPSFFHKAGSTRASCLSDTLYSRHNLRR